jgi:hypothetical protein
MTVETDFSSKRVFLKTLTPVLLTKIAPIYSIQCSTFRLLSVRIRSDWIRIFNTDYPYGTFLLFLKHNFVFQALFRIRSCRFFGPPGFGSGKFSHKSRSCSRFGSGSWSYFLNKVTQSKIISFASFKIIAKNSPIIADQDLRTGIRCFLPPGSRSGMNFSGSRIPVPKRFFVNFS